MLRKLVCLLFGHRYETYQRFRWSERIVCRDCGGDWGLHYETGAMLRWSRYLETMSRSHGVRLLDPWK